MDDADLFAARTPGIARNAGLALVSGGIFATLVGAQALTSLVLRGSLWLVPGLLAAGGAAAMVMGVLVLRGRASAAIAGAALAAVLLLADAAWVFIGMLNGAFSLMALMALMALGVAPIVVPFAVGPCRVATAARARLRAADLDLGA